MAPDGGVEMSADAFALLGYRPGDAASSLELLTRHIAPADRASWSAAIAQAATGRQSAAWLRLEDTRGRERTVVLNAVPTAQVVHGTFVELTKVLRAEQERRTGEALAAITVSRGEIEQAKGIIMVTLDVSAEQAFELLRWQSVNTNVKVRAVAARVIEELADPTDDRRSPRQRLAALLHAARGGPSLVRPVPDASRRDRHDAVAGARAADLPDLLLRAVAGSAQSISIGDASKPGAPLVYVNDAFAALTGHPMAEIVGKRCSFLHGPETDPATVDEMRDAIRAGRPVRVVVRNYRKDGSTFWNEVDLSPVRDASGTLSHVIGYQADVTERVERENLLTRLAFQDPATGLGNQAWVERRLAVVGAGTYCEVTVLGGHSTDGQQLGQQQALLVAADLLSSAADGGWVARPGERVLLVAPGPDTSDDLKALVRAALDGNATSLDYTLAEVRGVRSDAAPNTDQPNTDQPNTDH
jgi:PAS domain S-box-containing protein